MTNTPKSCGNAPKEVDLLEGHDYWWCTCGLSPAQPFCDGTHKNANTELRSHKFKAEKTGTAWLCMCKKTQNPPFCDGSHNA